jgi:hypothetical protein
MTYRTAPPPIERPRVNPQLERELLDYHHKHRRRDAMTIVVALCCLLPAAVGAMLHPTAGRAIAAFGVPGMFGLLIATWSLWLHRPYLLERLRTGVPIRGVRRAERKDFPTLYVEFVDGRTATLVGLGDEELLTRIEVLLHIQMTNGDEKLADRIGELFQGFAAR